MSTTEMIEAQQDAADWRVRAEKAEAEVERLRGEQVASKERIAELERDLFDIEMQSPPQRIEFCGDDGETYAIVYDGGDASVGIPAGYEIGGEWEPIKRADILAAEARVKALSDALRFYAMEESWAPDLQEGFSPSAPRAHRDAGYIARAALTAQGETK